jgi:leucyl aminopeptidase
MIVMRYLKGGDRETVALVGKGVTFDTGGISIKPTSQMHIMKTDMAGAAAVIGTMRAIAEMELPVNVIGLVPAYENMPSGSAYRPGDVLELMGGKTVEIITTDAEGRLGLADCLTYAKQLGASKLIDIATLTGACVVAFGDHVTGLLGNNQPLVDLVTAAGHRAGEKLWQLPIFPEHVDQIRGDVADLKNSGGREGGAITAGAFLKEFVGETPWAHLDIAGPSYFDRETASRDKGGTGVGLRTFVYLLESMS